MENVKNISDLLELAIKIGKTGTPKGFITTVWVSKEVRVGIFKELLDSNIDNDYWVLDKPKAAGYNFKILNYHFFVISNNL